MRKFCIMNAQRVKEPLAEGTTQNPTFQIFNYQHCHRKLTFLQYVGSHWRCQKRPICRKSTPYMRTTGPVFWRLHSSTVGADILRQASTPDFVVEACQNSALNFTWVTPRTARQLFLSPLNLKPCGPDAESIPSVHKKDTPSHRRYRPNPHCSFRILPPPRIETKRGRS